jgi:hypothetical protein
MQPGRIEVKRTPCAAYWIASFLVISRATPFEAW